MSYSEIRQVILDLGKQGEKLTRFAQHYFDGPFARLNLLAAMLWEYDPTKLHQTRFIDYAVWKHYYPDAPENIQFAAAGDSKKVAMPYQILVDLIEKPNAQISVIEPIAIYKMSGSLDTLTATNLEEYRKEKARTFNGRVVRLSDFKEIMDSSYVATIAHARYWDQVRTNLTIDLPVRSEGDARSLRERDLGGNGQLREFRDSMLVNSIGVSTVIGFRDTEHHWRFFNKLRRADDAVAEKMLASASGVAELLPGQHVRDLLSYAESEIIRELYNETGLSCEEVVRIVPLAFCRELVRGGKPQFMFFVEIDKNKIADFTELFRKSAEGLDEFYNSWFTSVTAHSRTLSYEFAFNLCLSLKFLQRERHAAGSPIQLTHI
jgi:hypothetical protein